MIDFQTGKEAYRAAKAIRDQAPNTYAAQAEAGNAFQDTFDALTPDAQAGWESEYWLNKSVPAWKANRRAMRSAYDVDNDSGTDAMIANNKLRIGGHR